MRVLIIAGDARMATRLRRRLWREGHVVTVAPNGAIGLQLAETGAYDAVIVHMTVTDVTGLAVTQQMRAAGVATPILMVATHASVDDCLRGLDAGADDYLSAPFAFDELSARLRAITRRGQRRCRRTTSPSASSRWTVAHASSRAGNGGSTWPRRSLRCSNT